MKTTNNLILGAIILLALSGIASAAGVASVYNGDNPMYLQPGETMSTQFNLQNLVGDAANMTLRAQVVNGTAIAVLTDSNKDYVVPFGTKDVLVNLKVTAPSTGKPGEHYNVRVSFTSVSKNDQGQFAFGSAFEQHFDVIIASPQPEAAASSSGTTVTYWIIAIVVILLLIFYVIKRNKN